MSSLSTPELSRGFEAFVTAAQRLEASYQELKARAEAVDLALAATNTSLQQALREREALFAALPIGVVALDCAGAVRFANTEGERLRAHAHAASGDLTSGECSVRVRRVALPDGELVLLEDRTGLARLERQVHRLDRLAGLSELALGVAHEIKNPLNGVMGFASLLQRSDDPDLNRRYVRKIHDGLAQIDGTVRALLAFARPKGREAVTATVFECVRRAAAAAGVPLSRIRTSGDLHETVEASALVTVFTNLFQNSRDASEGAVSLDVTATLTASELVLRVTDDGPGVPLDPGRRVLEPFVSTKDKGHGLGLALAARVISYLKGGLDLVNPGERGAIFEVRVPRETREVTARGTREEDDARVGAARG